MIDFSKFRSRSEEEREKDWQEQQAKDIKDELENRASLSTKRSKITLSDDPEVRSTMYGDKLAYLRGTRSDGSEFRGILTSYPHEEDFDKRVFSLSAGSQIDVEFHDKQRSWKDQNNNWRSTVEQIIDVAHGPAEFVYKVPHDLEMPKSAFQLKQEQAQKAAQFSAGMGR